MAMLVSAGITRAAAQESVSPAPASPVSGGKVIKEKPKTTMTAVGAVKTVAADSLAISDATGKDWTFVIDAKTKILAPTGKEGVDVGAVSPVEGGKVMPGTPGGPEGNGRCRSRLAHRGRQSHSRQDASHSRKVSASR